MAPRKFKNLNSNTGDLYAYKVEHSTFYFYELYHNFSKVGKVPPIVIEKSNDWQEIKEPVLTTQDGYQITDPNQDLWGADLADYETYPIKADEEAVESQFYLFYKYANAKQYVDEHRPKYSDADLKYLQEVCKNAEANSIIKEDFAKSIFMGINDLKRSNQTNSNQ